MMEPTTGPLITHQRAVLSFMSQQLKEGRGKRDDAQGTGRLPGNVSGPQGEAAGRRALRGPILPSDPLSTWGCKPKSQVTEGLLGKSHIPPPDLELLGGSTFP